MSPRTLNINGCRITSATIRLGALTATAQYATGTASGPNFTDYDHGSVTIPVALTDTVQQVRQALRAAIQTAEGLDFSTDTLVL